jgi:intracellular protein transport protein USO1
LQGNFAQLRVASPLEEPDHPADADAAKAMAGSKATANGTATVYAIDGLLDLTLAVHVLAQFNIRLAACECLKAYFFRHLEIRQHFLARAIDGHRSGRDETSNVLTALLQPSPQTVAGDPYKLWFAAVIMFHLLFDHAQAKANAMTVTEGDADSGEEVVTCIQTIAGQLAAGLGRGDDSRVLVGYLMVLLGWLFEDLDAVNDFLGEGSHVQSLIQAVLQPASADEIVRGLCAMLLGMVYEFSTKDSPIPRATLHPLLTSRLGRERYLDSLNKLRSHPLMRDFEVTPQKLDASTPGRLPDVFFDASFVEFFKDNYNRATRAIDRDPGIEIPVVTNGVHKGISRELVDSLRAQLEEKQATLQDVEATLASSRLQLEQEQADHRRTRDSTSVELSRIKDVNDALQRHHDEELRYVSGGWFSRRL